MTGNRITLQTGTAALTFEREDDGLWSLIEISTGDRTISGGEFGEFRVSSPALNEKFDECFELLGQAF